MRRTVPVGAAETREDRPESTDSQSGQEQPEHDRNDDGTATTTATGGRFPS